ncbi:MAG: transglutaminase domain-containing protein [Halobacterium sp.]
MSDAPPDGPDTRRALLAVVAVLGLLTASTVAPALAGQTPLGDVDSPDQPRDVPGFLRNFDLLRELLGQNQPADVEASGGAFGALRLGSSTSVGGPVSQKQRRNAATPHFVGRTEEPTYWRTGAYVDYTGSGWARDDVNRIQPSRPVSARDREQHRVTLRQPATALPTPWRPVDIATKCTDAASCGVVFSLTDTSGIRAEPALEAGQEYQVTTLNPVTDPDLLRQVRVQGSISSTKYTRVDTTDRVEQLAARVVGDAENRYDAAKAVESYLEAEKTYSLSDVPKPGDRIADQFLFEQDAGYCEYFATAMVVMLRSQDVPARYVVGYAPGERVGEDRYLVRGADAHAWVEVYFENLGWVRFDPTPTAPREAADDRLAEGSPTYRISVNESLVPGQSVQAKVTSGGIPAPGVAVAVNGERVGVTNADGRVTFTVPYAETVNVTARPADRAPDSLETGSGNNATAFGTGATTAFAQDGGEQNGTTRSFQVDASVRFRFDGAVEPGATLPATVTIEGRPFANATVVVAGEVQGQTDADGDVTVRIPEDASGVVELTARRGDLTRTQTFPLDDLVVSVSPSLVAPFPTAGATARVTSGGEAVTGAVVRVNGERVGVTGENGELSFEMPLSRTPSVTASASGKTAVTYVDGVLVALAAAVLAVLAALAGLAVAARRRGVTVAGVVAAVRYAASEIASGLVGAVVGLADALDDLAAEFRAAADEGWREVLAWLASLPSRASLPDVRAWAAGVAAAARAAAGNGDREGDAGPTGSLQAVWRQFVAVVGVRRWRTKTPAEVAREAVSAGFPERPVYALTTAFRDAAYGGRDTDSRLDRARDALAELRSDDEEGGQ